MHQAKDLITQPLGESAQTSSATEHNESERRKVETLWSLMTQMFGHRWASSYGDAVDPDGVWRASLKGISEQLVKQGLNQVAESGLSWPPSAPEFRAMCMDDYGTEATDWEHRRVEAATREWRQNRRLEQKRSPETIEKGHQVVAGLRELMRT